MIGTHEGLVGELIPVNDPRWGLLVRDGDVFHWPAWASAHRGAGTPVLAAAGGVVAPVVLDGIVASSPPGFAGAYFTSDPFGPTRSLARVVGLLADEGVAALYLRLHPLLGRDLPVSRVPGDVVVLSMPPPVVLDLASWDFGSMRSGHRRQVAKAQEAGFTVKVFTGDRLAVAYFNGLHDETMARVGGDSRHAPTMSEMAAVALPTAGLWSARTVLCYAPDGLLAAGAVILGFGARATYWWGATSDRFVGGRDPLARFAPLKLVLATAAQVCRADGYATLNLTGGMAHDDELERFKLGFGGRRVTPNLALKVILDRPRYDKACRAANVPSDPTGFFPPWRAPNRPLTSRTTGPDDPPTTQPHPEPECSPT